MRFSLVSAAMVVAVASAYPALAQPLRGTVEARSFVDAASGRTVRFNVYLPEGYAASKERYPVIYHCHGLGGSQGGPQNTTVPRSFETAETQGVIGPVIVVFPNGYTNSWWADSFGGNKPAETDVISRLIPHVDANFRTIARRGARVIEGFSMGGFGATKFYSKFPDLFAACVEYDGALLTWASIEDRHADLAAEIFGNDEEYFNQYSPWYWMDVNAPVLREGPPLRMVVGALQGTNRVFRDYVLARGIEVDYVETACEHELGCLMQAEGVASAAFIAAHLDLGCPADYDDDGTVTSQDFFDFLGAFFALDPAADFNADGAINSEDFFGFLAA